jgi:DeoR family fructose operon transcriptional repressor
MYAEERQQAIATQVLATGRVSVAELAHVYEVTTETVRLPVANHLATIPSVSLQLLGGRVRGLTQAVVGEQALRTLRSLRIDVAFIGTNGISVRHGLSTPDSDEAAIKRTMVESANCVVVTADSTKIGQDHLVSFAPLSAVDVLITDQEITAQSRAALTAAGLEVVVAQEAA